MAPRVERPDTLPSTYAERGTQRGPEPVPEWVITSDQALDTDLGILKSGKEADVSLVERTLGEDRAVMAVKRYRDVHHRSFRDDAVYRAGRQLRDARAQKAAEKGTATGIEVRASSWATTEFEALGAVWKAGGAVPYPVQLRGTELVLEYLGDEDSAAPRLVNARVNRKDAPALCEQTIELMRVMAGLALVHGDLSPYNLMVWDGRVFAIDFPQAADLVLNPNGRTLLERDVANVCTFFERFGVETDTANLVDDLMKLARS